MKERLFLLELVVRAARPPYLPKALALLMAAALWFHFSADEEASVEFRVSPRVQNVPAHLVLVNGNFDVSVRVHGPVSTLRKISGRDIELRLDLSRAGAGVQYVPVDVSDAHLPFGTRIARVSPTVVAVELAETPASP